ncbi:hypothetical protein AYM40_29175 [Paraburkholderia phytofirmans OLGA172]|uniref:Uncharacterized protein n=1 Tax=Paraburkholderia phytofirmans OLGA172 TaxID=1417228 RepID=A0A160FTI4_9BURK|nr:hypothetical protein [Paraburkholderia phytofirmans]ANB76321.1 hypothetical protein AYM40_29175 [Paraburkholderia phytofirmans OLGA172]
MNTSTLDGIAPNNTCDLLQLALADAFCLLVHFQPDWNATVAFQTPDILLWLLEHQNPRLLDAIRERNGLAKLGESLARLERLRSASNDHWIEHCWYSDSPDVPMEYPGIDYMIERLELTEEFLADSTYSPLLAAAHIASAQLSGFVPFYKTRDAAVSPDPAAPAHFPSPVPDRDVAPVREFSVPGATPMEIALSRAASILEELDDGKWYRSFWETVYAQKVGEWVEEDLPHLAPALVKEANSFFESLHAYRREMIRVEGHWSCLGEPFRAYLEQIAHFPEEAKAKIRRVIGDSNQIEEPERGDAQHLERVWVMLLRRRCGRQNGASVPAIFSPEIPDTLAGILKDPSAADTAYLIDTSALPENMANTVSEKQCIAVTLADDYLLLTPELSKGRLDMFGFSARNDSAHYHILALNDAFWCEHSALWPNLFSFRQHVPVLYVFGDACLLVQYEFNHFLELRWVVDYDMRHMLWHREDNEGFPGKLPDYIKVLPGGTRLRPKIIGHVKDLRKLRSSRTLCDVYERANPSLTVKQSTVFLIRSAVGADEADCSQ